MDWQVERDFPAELDREAIARLSGLRPVTIKARTVLFRPGDQPPGFLVVLSGRVSVHLVGRSGRELELYTVGRGETCVQTTLGLMGGQAYSAEAIAETDLAAVIVPPGMFEELLARSPAFRRFVFRAFATRVGDVMFVLEQVAFVKVENRLAAHLLERAGAACVVTATHEALANAIGSAREVVSRQLKALASRGLIKAGRSRIEILDRDRLETMAADET